jgi:hypothetical protein
MDNEDQTTQHELYRADGRTQVVSRITFPTASFSLTTFLIAWIAEESERRGVSKSVLVREILTAAMEEQERDVA